MINLVPLVSSLASGLLAHIAPSPLAETRSIHVTSDLQVGCLAESYYGSYGGSSLTKEHIYLPTSGCLSQVQSLQDAKATVATGVPGRLVWVGPAGVDPSLVNHNTTLSWESIQSLARAHDSAMQTSGQLPFTESPEILLLHQSPTSLLLHVPPSHLAILDTLLPAHLVPVALPTTPLSNVAGWESVPKHLVENLANITSHLQFDPVLSKVLNEGIQMDNVRKDVRWLTGEGPSGIESRHSFTSGAIKAAHWIKGESLLVLG